MLSRTTLNTGKLKLIRHKMQKIEIFLTHQNFYSSTKRIDPHLSYIYMELMGILLELSHLFTQSLWLEKNGLLLISSRFHGHSKQKHTHTHIYSIDTITHN